MKLGKQSATGWWEQHGTVRQPMRELQLSVSGGNLTGTGVDIVGPFSLDGAISPDGVVSIEKQYVRRHAVDYRGVFDGKRTLTGTWFLKSWSGPWEIVLERGIACDDVQGAVDEAESGEAMERA